MIKRTLFRPRAMFYLCMLNFWGVVLVTDPANSQSFEDITALLEDVVDGTVAWGDFNNDGYLDIAAAGINRFNEHKLRVYEYNADFFVDTHLTDFLLEYYPAGVAWGDFNNDNYLDLAFSSLFRTTVYRNNNKKLADLKLELVKHEDGVVIWGDYDNDGDLDLLVTGGGIEGTHSVIYRNNNGIFEETQTGLDPVRFGSAAWGDYDNDGDLDILLAGAVPDANILFRPVTKVYQNQGGRFMDIEANLPPTTTGKASWVDYDQDGDLDIFLTGNAAPNIISPGPAITKIFENTSSGFLEKKFNLPGLFNVSAAWGDYDNDGDLDFVISGSLEASVDRDGKLICKGEHIARLLRNDDSTFSELSNIGIEPVCNTRANSSAIACGDYNNDGALDLLIAGKSGQNTFVTRVYQNKIDRKNTPPERPQNLKSFINDNRVMLNWNSALDIETKQRGLSYNVRIGTQPGGVDVLSPMAEVSSGFRRIPQIGNAGHDTTWWISGLKKGTYYWSVQAIDNTFTGSGFSEEQSFVISLISPPQNLTAESGNGQAKLSWKMNTDENLLKYYIYGAETPTPTARIDSTSSPADTMKIITGLKNGTTYYFRVTAITNNYEESSWSNEVIATPTLFFETSIELLPMDSSTVAWGDYDDDGDLDILMTGLSKADIRNPYFDTKIYENANASFSEVNVSIDRTSHNALAWGDYDNDNDLDFLFAGTRFADVFENRDGAFVQINTGFSPAAKGVVKWADYDNDGDLDALIIGNFITKLYRNEGNRFRLGQSNLVGIQGGDAAFADYDNDGDLDLLITGEDGSARPVTVLYENQAGSFVDSKIPLQPLKESSAAWGDYDGDGDPDLLLTGLDERITEVSILYKNTILSFLEVSTPFEKVYDGSVVWGDYDNDGDLDILLTGRDFFANIYTQIYENKEGSFVEINAGLIPIYNGSATWGDYDSDSDLDIILTGSLNDLNRVTKIYKNDISIKNSAPVAPSNLMANVEGSRVTLTWSPADDKESPQKSLTYNLRVGTEPGGAQTLSPMADVQSGFRKIVEVGNVQHNTKWTLRNLRDGTYYWSVQAIDNSFAASAFSEEGTFAIVEPLPPQNLKAIPGNARVTLKWNKNEEIDIHHYRIYGGASPNPPNVIDSTNANQDTVKVIMGLTNGQEYFFRITAVDNQSNESEPSNEVSAKPTSSRFVALSDKIAGVVNGEVLWGDIDNDDDLDLLITGGLLITDSPFNPRITKLYRNEDGTFVETPDSLISLVSSAAAFGDYDNDNDLDILLTGKAASDEAVTRIYRNDLGGFTDINADIVDVYSGSVDWADFDNDGDLDILLTGLTNDGSYISRVYLNTGPGFIQSNTELVGIGNRLSVWTNSMAAWADFDNDGAHDVLLAGEFVERRFTTKLYLNAAGLFFDTMINLPGVGSGAAAWGDYDSDGDWDFILTGRDEGTSSFEPNTFLFQNQRTSFAEIAASIDDVMNSDVAWGDFDNDGDLDLLLTGEDIFSQPLSKIYLNENGNFTFLATELSQVRQSAVAVGDFDNDTDLDVLISGTPNGPFGQAAIFRNNGLTINTHPNFPDSLRVSVRRNSATLSWGKGIDPETPQKALTYNLRVGTTPGSYDIVSPMSNPETGFRRIPQFGNAGLNTSWSLKDLPDEKYYWSIQTIDNSFAGSAFAPEMSFIISTNNPPTVVAEIPDTTIYIGVFSYERDLNEAPVVFRDEDGDALTYSVFSSDLSVALPSISGSLLRVQPLSIGVATIKVIADDGRGRSDSTKFNLTVAKNEPPVIQEAHVITPKVEKGKPDSIRAIVDEDVGIKSASLWYRIGGNSDSSRVDMKPAANPMEFIGVIRANDVTELGLEYFVRVEDLGGLTDRMPKKRSLPIQVFIPGPAGVVNNRATQPAGIGDITYRLVSLPLEVTNQSPASVWGALGEYNIKKWRFFELMRNQELREFDPSNPNTIRMEAGKAFWLNVATSGFRMSTGEGKTIRIDTLFSFGLHPQWNFIGNPFNFNIPLNRIFIRFADSLHAINPRFVRYYSGSWNNPESEPDRVPEIVPFEGYALYNNFPGDAELIIDPGPDGMLEIPVIPAVSQADDDRLWSLRINAQCDRARDTDNVISIHKTASKVKDAFDQYEPPYVGEFVSLYFPFPHEDTSNARLCVDARPELQEGDSWNFEIITNIRAEVKLKFDGVETVPEQYEVWLIDAPLQIVQNLRQKSEFATAGGSSVAPKRLKIVIGQRQFVEAALSSIDAIPTTYELSQNFPNPFNPVTTIRFGLPKPDKVTLRIFNTLGEEVVTLLRDEPLEPGFHAVQWNGHTRFENVATSGLYFYQFKTGEYTQVKKMALIK